MPSDASIAPLVVVVIAESYCRGRVAALVTCRGNRVIILSPF